MNKQILALLLVIGTMAGSQAFASRARILTMGTGDAAGILGTNGNGGSLLTDDAYNMFYNPAYVNDYKDWAIIEKTAGTFADNTKTRAEGGFVTGIANLNVGLYMDRTTQFDGTWNTANSLDMHPIDLMVGGDMGVKWGLGLNYANNHQGDNSDTNLDVRVGIEHDGFEPFVSYKAIGNENIGTTQFKHKDWMAGLRYHYGEWTPYAVFRTSKIGDNRNMQAWAVGSARKMKVAEGVRVEYGFGFARSNNGGIGFADNGTTKDLASNNRSIVPLNVAVEGDVLSWLTLRGGVSYNLWDRNHGDTVTDNTTGRIGAGLHAGKMTFDWMVGYSGDGTESATTGDSQTFSFANGLFSAASLSYNW